MAALKYRDEHKKVGYLLKPTGSDDYHQIINFLRASHIRSHELGPSAIQATIDKTPYTITKGLVKSRLQLADDGGIDDLPIVEIYYGMDNLGPFTNVKDAHVRGSFHISPPRSTPAPPAGQPSGGAEDLITLTALSFVVSTLVQKVHYLETELKDHKKLFKNAVGKLVKRVKAIEVKLKTKKRKIVVSDSDQEDGRKQDVDLDALRTLANAVVTVASNIPSGGTSQIPAASPSVPTAVPTSASIVPTGASTVPASEGYASLSKTLLGDDVSEDNFPARMAALIKRKKQALAEKLAKERMAALIKRKKQALAEKLAKESMAYVKSFTDDQLKEEFEKIYKSTEAPIPSVPEVPQSPVVSSPLSSRIRWKSLSWKRITKPKSTLLELNLDVDAQTFIKVVVNKDSDDEASPVWSALVGWEILHMVDRHDLVKLYGLVVKYYENNHVASVGLILWDDLQVLFDSKTGDKVLYMFADVYYPLSVNLMERMLTHKLEIDTDVVGNDMTTAEQLI
uniref:Aminoacyl-tRNA synthetase, class 1a, anticodon-binding n=1 Tax=Tanacetum cinerariifolium TaxID=118510 RepID=A0A6L2JDN4_TANCI|nr:hypothetical protein [Tanacetum cinerariifolium]